MVYKLNEKESNKKKPKMTEPKNKSNKKTNFLSDIQEWLQLIKWTMFASVDKSESAVFCDTLPLYIARARY